MKTTSTRAYPICIFLVVVVGVLLYITPAMARSGEGGVAPAKHSSTQGASCGSNRPVLGAACPNCPYGSLAEIIKAAVDQYGYNVKICYTCNGAERAVNLVTGRAPLPPEAGGQIDFGITAAQYVWWAYQGAREFAKEGGPARNLRLIAYLQSPSYLLVAARRSSGISDLRQIMRARMPVKVLAAKTPGISDVLDYFGISNETLRTWGGAVIRSTSEKNLKDADVIISYGALDNTPEHNVWYQESQKQNLKYLQLPASLVAAIASRYDLQVASVPAAYLRGIDRPIPTVVRTGIVIYARKDMPAKLAYTVAKALDQHQDMLQWDLMNISYNANNVFAAYGLPLHPGAARYYRERGYLAARRFSSNAGSKTR